MSRDGRKVVSTKEEQPRTRASPTGTCTLSSNQILSANPLSQHKPIEALKQEVAYLPRTILKLKEAGKILGKQDCWSQEMEREVKHLLRSPGLKYTSTISDIKRTDKLLLRTLAKVANINISIRWHCRDTKSFFKSM